MTQDKHTALQNYKRRALESDSDKYKAYAEIEKLREALSFYADLQVYRAQMDATNTVLVSAIEFDQGERARQALSNAKGGDDE